MEGRITFRDAINHNKKMILDYLNENGNCFTSDICHGYGGEREMPSVRKALNELRKEGKVFTDDKVRMWQGKLWSLNQTKE